MDGVGNQMGFKKDSNRGWRDGAIRKVLLYKCEKPGSGQSWAQKRVLVIPAPEVTQKHVSVIPVWGPGFQ